MVVLPSIEQAPPQAVTVDRFRYVEVEGRDRASTRAAAPHITIFTV